MPLTLANVTQANVESEVSKQYTAGGEKGPCSHGAHPRIGIPPDPNGDFMRAFTGGRRNRTDEVIEVTTEKIGTGRLAVLLVPNTKNSTIKNLHGTIKHKVGETQL
jgi:hypothetical protein